MALSLKGDLPALVAQYRQDNNLSLTAFARQLGMSRNTISSLEQGKLVTYSTAHKLLAAITGEEAR